MGCAGSKSPDEVLVRQPRPEHVTLQDAVVQSNYLELHGRRDKGSSLTTVLGNVAAPLKRPSVEVWEKPEGGGVVVQVAQDTWSFPSRDPVVTFFDRAGKPMAVLVFRFKDLKSTAINFDGRPALYARDIPARTDKNFLSDMVAGNKLADVSASLTMADGTVMPCVGLIHQHEFCRDDLALYRVDGEQFVTTREQAELILRADVPEVTNAKGEVVAFRKMGTRKVFVAAGVDAVLALALIAASEVRGAVAVAAAVG